MQDVLVPGYEVEPCLLFRRKCGGEPGLVRAFGCLWFKSDMGGYRTSVEEMQRWGVAGELGRLKTSLTAASLLCVGGIVSNVHLESNKLGKP